MGLCRSERRNRLALLAAAVIYTVSWRAIQFPEMSSARRWKSVKISVSIKSHSGSDNHTATGLLLQLRWSPRTRKNSSCFRNLLCERLCAEILRVLPGLRRPYRSVVTFSSGENATQELINRFYSVQSESPVTCLYLNPVRPNVSHFIRECWRLLFSRLIVFPLKNCIQLQQQSWIIKDWPEQAPKEHNAVNLKENVTQADRVMVTTSCLTIQTPLCVTAGWTISAQVCFTNVTASCESVRTWHRWL